MSHREDELVLFLAGDLPPGEAEEFDRHLLGCDECWRAVSEDQAGTIAAGRLRGEPPFGLAERLSSVVLEADAGRSTVAAALSRRRRRAVAVATALMIGAAPAAGAIFALYSPETPARARHVEASQTGATAVGAERAAIFSVVGRPVDTGMIHTDRGDAVLATSPAMFPMPVDAVAVSADGMAWSARRGTVTLYCLNNDHPSVLLAGSSGLRQLIAVAHAMHLDG